MRGKSGTPNLIKGLKVDAPSVIWQSDITYLPVDGHFYYAVFIIDVYSKKIVGYKVSRTMQATAGVGALAMALRSNESPRIHHSDRGSQYSSQQYLSLLREHKTKISMGLKAQENAYAERINRTIKEEYLDRQKITSYDHLKRKIAKAVKHYNNQRPHNHLNRMTPVAFEQIHRCDPTFMKPRITIFDDNNLLKPVNPI